MGEGEPNMDVKLYEFTWDEPNAVNYSCVVEGDRYEALKFKNAIKRNGGFNIRRTVRTKDQFYEDLTSFILG